MLGLKNRDAAMLLGIGASAMSDFLKGRTSFDAARIKNLHLLLDDLETLNKIFPVKVAVHDAKCLALALDRLREGKFKPFHNLSSEIDWTETVEETQRISRDFPKVFKEVLQ
jgi:hypothetical protein